MTNEFLYCNKCARRLFTSTSKQRSLCGMCDDHSLTVPMKRPPSFYIGSTRRFSKSELFKRRTRWELERVGVKL